MKITYKNKKIKKVCTDASFSDKSYGKAMSGKIQQRIAEISASDSVEVLLKNGIGRCHPLFHNRKGQYAMSLEEPYRLIFEKIDSTVQIAKICELVDYHKK